ncbi:hypothetical protein JOF53_006900 [Crossiella equi]|uniref:Uncharacterized protein n=1 Tax=Crossiella equi TaxID=130796 RepID=A0ABS5AN65_9PSEU|nr:hypothetical protein [Crossiella equi]MBP2478028.1 hypothetical protein [Crossiella equi]
MIDGEGELDRRVVVGDVRREHRTRTQRPVPTRSENFPYEVRVFGNALGETDCLTEFARAKGNVIRQRDRSHAHLTPHHRRSADG